MDLSLFIALVGASCLSHGLAQTTAQPQVTLNTGTLRGFYDTTLGGRQIASFESIPYAKQPMGRHRFKDSIEMGPWLGVYDATSKAPDCVQSFPNMLSNSIVVGSEDCLYINVYTPHVPTGTQAKPLLDVLVYIHGGAFMFYGSQHFSPKYLLDKDIVLVTFNYRLGPLGFASSGDSTLPGNAGLKDQVMALRWVQRYISSFGGDPGKVTVAGHSAGGASVHYHILSPLSRGLFHKAIVSSGSVLNPWAKSENVKENTVALADKLGCSFQDFNLMIKCLRTRPAYHIAGFSKQLSAWGNVPFSPFAPSVEATAASAPSTHHSPGLPQPFLTEEPLSVITSGQASDIPIMFSYTSSEGSFPGAFFLFNDKTRDELSKRWEELLPAVLDYSVDPSQSAKISQAIKQNYLSGINMADKAASIPPLVEMLSDRIFVAGVAESSRLHAQTYTSPVYTFKFSYKSEQSSFSWMCNCSDSLPGALHYDDAGFLVDYTRQPMTSALDKQVQSRLIDLWYSFITTGKPVYEGMAVPQVKTSLPDLTYLDIGQDGNPSIRTETDPGQHQFWKSIGLTDSLPTSGPTHTEL